MLSRITLINGLGGPPIPDACIVWDDGKIVAAGPQRTVTPPRDARVLDGHNGFALPGFIDCHVHFFVSGPSRGALLSTPPSLVVLQAARNAERTLYAGVTTARDLGGADAGFKSAQQQGLVRGPKMKIAVRMLSITGGHGDHYQPGIGETALLADFSVVCDGPEEVRRTVRRMLRAGADVIKVATSGGVLSQGDHPRHVQFSPEELAVMAQEALFHDGTPMAAHAGGADGVKNAVRAGFRTVEHGLYLDDEAIDLMRERGVYLVPTLHAPVSILELAQSHGIHSEMVDKAEEAIEAHRQSVARAYRAGVKIAMGTDAGVGMHGTNLRELALLCGIGMSPMEAIVAATKTAAECLGVAAETGTIEVGKAADIVVAAQDPLASPASLADPVAIPLVVQAGVVVKEAWSSSPR